MTPKWQVIPSTGRWYLVSDAIGAASAMHSVYSHKTTAFTMKIACWLLLRLGSSALWFATTVHSIGNQNRSPTSLRGKGVDAAQRNLQQELICAPLPTDRYIHDNWRLVSSGFGGYYHIIAQHSGLALAGKFIVVSVALSYLN
jgi:hypothetical protein